MGSLAFWLFFCFDIDLLPGKWVFKRDAESMQEVFAVFSRRPSVQFIADDRVLDVRQMGADLMRAPSLQS